MIFKVGRGNSKRSISRGMEFQFHFFFFFSFPFSRSSFIIEFTRSIEKISGLVSFRFVSNARARSRPIRRNSSREEKVSLDVSIVSFLIIVVEGCWTRVNGVDQSVSE